jgi:Sugar (and other) transporter
VSRPRGRKRLEGVLQVRPPGTPGPAMTSGTCVHSPSCLMIPLRLFMSESPRWLAANGRYEEADRIVSRLEKSATASGRPLNPLAPIAPTSQSEAKSNWRELFKGIYLKRTLTIWTLWFCAYLIANGLVILRGARK